MPPDYTTQRGSLIGAVYDPDVNMGAILHNLFTFQGTPSKRLGRDRARVTRLRIPSIPSNRSSFPYLRDDLILDPFLRQPPTRPHTAPPASHLDIAD